jgi:hypothetical protein
MLREIVVQNLSTNESHSEEDPTDFQKLVSPANTNTQIHPLYIRNKPQLWAPFFFSWSKKTAVAKQDFQKERKKERKMDPIITCMKKGQFITRGRRCISIGKRLQ